MMEMNEWLMLLAAVVVGIGALFVAASAEAGTVTGLGLAVFIAAVGYAIFVVKRYFDRIEGQS